MLSGDEGGYDDKIASHLAWLTKHVAQILGEVRKLEAHDKAIVDKLTPEERDRLVVEYLNELPPDRRAGVREMLDALDAEEASIL